MRPVNRGGSPIQGDFADYTKAKPDLIARFGCYCCYCERQLSHVIAVEHIQPKADNLYPQLEGRWDNFLLSCVNCNATKSDKDVQLDQVLLPDRDNTSRAFTYAPDGSVVPAAGLTPELHAIAEATLSLTGLDKSGTNIVDVNGKLVAIDRVAQRMQTWAEAEVSKSDIVANPGNEPLKQTTVRLAVNTGFFSVWMRVFDDDQEMRSRLINAFDSTQASGCFDQQTQLVSPAPNPDALVHGGKI